MSNKRLINNDDNESDSFSEEESIPKKKSKNIIFNKSYTGSVVLKKNKQVANINVSKKIRKYLDLVYSVIALANNKNSWVEIIPSVVSNILRFNNIQFDYINLYITNVQTIEPVMFTYNISESCLDLYMNSDMHKDYCTTKTVAKINWVPKEIDVEKYNSFDAYTNVDLPMVKCAVFCDHVAQHIIASLTCDLKDSADPHENYTEQGCTFASIFDITKSITNPIEKESEQLISIISKNIEL